MDIMMMRHQKSSPRSDYRLRERQRVNESVSLSEKFRELKSLTVELAYFSPEGVSQNGQLKCTTNPDHAKSVFRVDCVNGECVAGDFDLSEALGQAVAARQSTATGEMCCRGWLSKTTIDQVHCRHILRYKLILGYSTPAPTGISEL
jgi:hypothetical protein